MRTRPPALRTLPSSTWLTLSCARDLRHVDVLALERERACCARRPTSAETLLRSVMMSSVMPSLKYSCSGSPLMLANGSTQIEMRADPCRVTAVPRRLRRRRGLRRPCARDHARRARAAVPAPAGSAGFSPQPSRSVVWMARTSIGRSAPSKRTGTSTPRSAASRASPRTQRDSTEVGVQTTTHGRGGLELGGDLVGRTPGRRRSPGPTRPTSPAPRSRRPAARRAPCRCGRRKRRRQPCVPNLIGWSLGRKSAR